MIRKIVLQNFQPHKKREVKLSRVTVVSGDSFRGKSAFVRALLLLATNKPRGKSYVRHGSNSLSVSAVVSGKKVTLRRGKRGGYSVDSRRYAPERQRSVPRAVDDLLNLGPVNFQRQDEPHLWLYDTPGQVAKHLNQIADLDTMDRVMAAVAKQVRKAAAEVSVTKERLKAAKAEAESLKWIPAVVRRAERLRRREKRIAAIRATIARMERSVSDASGLHRTVERLSQSDYSRLAALRSGAKLVDASSESVRLAELVQKVETNRPVRMPDFKKVVASRTKADAFAERRRALEDLITRAEQCSGEYSDLNTRLNRSQKRLSKFSNKRCPTCGRKWPSSPPATSTSRKSPRKPGRKKATTG